MKDHTLLAEQTLEILTDEIDDFIIDRGKAVQVLKNALDRAVTDEEIYLLPDPTGGLV